MMRRTKKKTRMTAKWTALLAAAMLGLAPAAAEELPAENAAQEEVQEQQPVQADITFDENGLALSPEGALLFAAPSLAEDPALAEFGYADLRSYAITDAGELAWFVSHFYQGALETANVHLEEDIDLQPLLAAYDLTWSPIGYEAESGDAAYYDGVFNGNGYSVSGLVLDQESGKYRDLLTAVLGYPNTSHGVQGFFGALGGNARVLDLGLTGAKAVGGAEGLAVLAGRSYGQIRGVMVTDAQLSLAGSGYVTELVYDNKGTLAQSLAAARLENLRAEDGTVLPVSYVPACVSNEGSIQAVVQEITAQEDQTVYGLYDGITQMSGARLASGEAAWQLNAAGVSRFGQDIGTNALPAYAVMQTDENGNERQTNGVYRVIARALDGTEQAIYTNGDLPAWLFEGGRAWQLLDEAGNAMQDVAADTRISSDAVLAEQQVITVQEAPYRVPEGLTALAGQSLAEVALPGDELGYFVWQSDPATVLTEGVQTFEAIYTPYDTEHYYGAEHIPVAVNVSRQDAVPTEFPANPITVAEGEVLASAALPAGWAWADGSIIPEDQGSYTVIYTPEDTLRYRPVEYGISVAVQLACRHEDTRTENTATCTEGGVESVICNICGEILSQTEVPALGHQYDENGYCVRDGAADPDYDLPVSAFLLEDNLGPYGWYHGEAVLAAPEGYLISLSSDPASFGETTALILGEEGSYTVSYYLREAPEGRISRERTLELAIDRTAPVIEGAEEGQVFCGLAELTVTDNVQLVQLQVDGADVGLVEGRILQLSPASEQQTVRAVDIAGNESSITVTVNAGHTYENGICVYDGADDPDYMPPCGHEDTRTENTATCTEGGVASVICNICGETLSQTDTEALGHVYEDGVCTRCGAYDPDYDVEKEAFIASGAQGRDGWYTGAVVVQAPEGFFISDQADPASFGERVDYRFEAEGDHDLYYYLQNRENGAVTVQKHLFFKIDSIVPVLEGIVDDASYCLDNVPQLAVIDEHLAFVSVNGQEIPADGAYTFPEAGEMAIAAEDAAGNRAEALIHIFAEHVWDDGEVIREATTDETGLIRYSCLVCGEEREEEIPQLPTEEPTTTVSETTTEEPTTEEPTTAAPAPTTEEPTTAAPVPSTEEPATAAPETTPEAMPEPSVPAVVPTVPTVPTIPTVPTVPTVPTIPSVQPQPGSEQEPQTTAAWQDDEQTTVAEQQAAPTVPTVPAVPTVPTVPGSEVNLPGNAANGQIPAESGSAAENESTSGNAQDANTWIPAGIWTVQEQPNAGTPTVPTVPPVQQPEAQANPEGEAPTPVTAVTVPTVQPAQVQPAATAAQAETTLAMPTNPITPILGIEDNARMIGIVLVAIGAFAVALIIGIIAYLRKER